MTQIKTRRRMGWITIAFHWTMMICTLGLWTPVFLAGRRRRLSVTYMPPGAQPYPPQPPYGQQPPPQQPWQQWQPPHP